MEKRMNKEEVLDLLNSLKIDKNEYWILSSAALVLRDLFPDAGDLDIAVTDEGLKELEKNYNLKQKENGWYIVEDKVECVCDGKKENLNSQPELICGYYVQNINDYYKFLLSSEREKDKKRIHLIEEYIKTIKN